MKSIKRVFQLSVMITMMLLTLVSCNKDEVVLKAVNVSVLGYNDSSTAFEVSIDTVKYVKKLLTANSQLTFSMVYPHPSSQDKVVVRIHNKDTQVKVYEKEISLNNNQLEFLIPFIYVDGSILKLNEPVAHPEKNQLGFYIQYPESNDLIDIYMKHNVTNEILYIAKNVKPKTWTYVDYEVLPEWDDKNTLGSFPVYFVKAGTLDQWAFYDKQNRSSTNAFSFLFPYKLHNKNIVQSYFIKASTFEAPRAVNLFFTPKNY